MFREAEFRAFVVAVRAARRGRSCTSGRPCGQQVRDAGRRAHGAVNPNNGMSQLSAALSQFMLITPVEQPVLLSVTVRAEHSGT